jgi:transcription elongation factor GreA-like protein
MSKKLKITEEQLKRIMVKNINEQSEGMDVDVSAEAERMTDSFVTQFKELVGDKQELIDKLMVDLSNKLSTNGNESTTTEELPSSDDTDTQYEVNESVIKIKSEFNRFL